MPRPDDGADVQAKRTKKLMLPYTAKTTAHLSPIINPPEQVYSHVSFPIQIRNHTGQLNPSQDPEVRLVHLAISRPYQPINTNPTPAM